MMWAPVIDIAVIGDRVRMADHRARAQLEATERVHCFHTDDSLVYVPFCDDFGPMNLLCVMRFIDILEHKLAEFPDHKIVYCTEIEQRKLTNSVFLLGSYMVLKMNLSPEVVWSCFSDVAELVVPYRDATSFEPDFHLPLLDCWRGLAHAKALGWVDKYDMDEYQHYDNPLEGDLHEMVPDKLFAFRGPKALPGDLAYLDQDGFRAFSPAFYLDPFDDLNVSTVVRLNEREYDDAAFTAHGIACVDLEFDDCASPPAGVILRFMHAVRAAAGAVAVHCKAGLGRTGTLIALYMMTTHGFTAREAIAWLRIVRPGSVLGEQQHFLRTIEDLHSEITSARPAEAGGDGDAGLSAAAMPALRRGRDGPRDGRRGSASSAAAAPGGGDALATIFEEDDTCDSAADGSVAGADSAAERRLAVAAQIAAAMHSQRRAAAKLAQRQGSGSGGGGGGGGAGGDHGLGLPMPSLND